MDKISIVVPVYNSAEYLPQCLDSLVNQTYPNIEIICVDDGSTDHSTEILENYSLMSEKIKVIHQDNSGVSVARNRGMMEADGNWLMFVDSDDWIDLNTCEEMLNRAQIENAEVVMCSYVKEYSKLSHKVNVFDEQCLLKIHKQGGVWVHRRLYGPIQEETSAPQDIDILIAPWMQLFRRDILKEVKFKDINETGTFEDGLFQIDVYAQCTTFSYIDHPFYHYRKTNSGSITTKYKPNLAESHEKIYDILEKQIQFNHYGEEYIQGLNNRIVFELIGIAVNEAHSDTRISEKARRMKEIIQRPRRRKAFNYLDLSYLPWRWCLFFLLLKNQKTYVLMALLTLLLLIRNKL